MQNSDYLQAKIEDMLCCLLIPCRNLNFHDGSGEPKVGCEDVVHLSICRAVHRSSAAGKHLITERERSAQQTWAQEQTSSPRFKVRPPIETDSSHSVGTPNSNPHLIVARRTIVDADVCVGSFQVMG